MESKLILVIEDDKPIREIILELLEISGYRGVPAGNGKEGLDYLNSGAPLPDLILLDLMMPVLDGFQFKITQSQNPRFATIPVVMMSADGQASEQMKLISQWVLKKPVDIDVLLNTIEDVLSSQ